MRLARTLSSQLNRSFSALGPKDRFDWDCGRKILLVNENVPESAGCFRIEDRPPHHSFLGFSSSRLAVGGELLVAIASGRVDGGKPRPCLFCFAGQSEREVRALDPDAAKRLFSA